MAYTVLDLLGLGRKSRKLNEEQLAWQKADITRAQISNLYAETSVRRIRYNSESRTLFVSLSGRMPNNAFPQYVAELCWMAGLQPCTIRTHGIAGVTDSIRIEGDGENAELLISPIRIDFQRESAKQDLLSYVGSALGGVIQGFDVAGFTRGSASRFELKLKNGSEKLPLLLQAKFSA